MVFNDNVQLLDEVRKSSGALDDSLAQRRRRTERCDARPTRPYIVVSIEDHRLWYKQGDSVLFTTAGGDGERQGAGGERRRCQWKFETPRGRLVVQAKEEDPAWIPPDWHFVEQARKRGLGHRPAEPRPDASPPSDGSQITVEGTDVVRTYPDGRVVPIERGRRKGARSSRAATSSSRRTARTSASTRACSAPTGSNMGDGYALPRDRRSGEHWPLGQPRVRAAAQRGHRQALRHGLGRNARLHLLIERSVDVSRCVTRVPLVDNRGTSSSLPPSA